jgi:hypothetical protein
LAVNKVKILHLYPNELNLYGDSGNVLCLYNRCLWHGIPCSVDYCGIGDKISDFDILFIGGGQDREMNVIKNDLRKKADTIKYCIDSGKVVLAICGGYQLLGEYYQSSNGEIMNLTKALPFYTVASKDRMIGNCVFNTEFGKIVGFENHSGKTYLSPNLQPLGNVISGFGNNGSDNGEGVHYKNTFGTYAHGPVLPKNPAFADELIKIATKSDQLTALDDDLENACYNQLIKRFS